MFKKKKKKLDKGTLDALKRLREEKYKRLNGITNGVTPKKGRAVMK